MNAERVPVKGFRGRIIYAPAATRAVDLSDGVMTCDARGRIVRCESFESFCGHAEDIPVEDMRGLLIIPGLVDCHLHLPQLDQRGKFGVTLLDWLEDHILPAEMAFADDSVVEFIGRRFFKRLILNGTTTAAIYSSVHERATQRFFEFAKQSGIRAIMGKVMMDRHAPPSLTEDTAASIEASMRLCERWHGAEGGRLAYAFTPRFAPTCSMALWREVGRLVKETGAYLQSHIAETLKENELVHESHPHLKDYFALFEETGTAGPRTILGHAIYLTDGEYRRMAASGTRAVHCPTSNFFLKSGSMPLSRLDDAGVIVGLGTDIGAGTSMSLFAEMRHADYTQRDMHVTPVRALHLATMGGARVLSMDADIGSFDEGKCADFCVIDIRRIDDSYSIDDFSTMDLLSLIMYRGDRHIVRDTYVAGDRLHTAALES